MHSKTPRDYLIEAIGIAGSQEALAEQCGCSQNKIWYAKDKGFIDPVLAMRIEKATGVPARCLRPDLPWPEPTAVQSVAS